MDIKVGDTVKIRIGSTEGIGIVNQINPGSISPDCIMLTTAILTGPRINGEFEIPLQYLEKV